VACTEYSLTQQRIQAYLHTTRHPDPCSRLATIDMGRKKLGRAAVPLWVGGAGFPYNIMSLGPRPTSVPSGILIHETVWPQCTRVTDDRQQTTDDRQTTYHDNSGTLHCNGRLKTIKSRHQFSTNKSTTSSEQRHVYEYTTSGTIPAISHALGVTDFPTSMVLSA